MPDLWRRHANANPNDGGFYGGMMGISVLPGETVLRTWWNFEVHGLWAPANTYPPGNSLLKVGLLYDEAGLPLENIPTPVSQGFADWMSLSTCPPRIVQLSRATNVAWQINWGFAQDISAKSMRKNDTTGVMGLYISWEFALAANRIPGFAVEGWSFSMDSLVRVAP